MFPFCPPQDAICPFLPPIFFPSSLFSVLYAYKHTRTPYFVKYNRHRHTHVPNFMLVEYFERYGYFTPLTIQTEMSPLLALDPAPQPSEEP